jgi:hypothetical protein
MRTNHETLKSTTSDAKIESIIFLVLYLIAFMVEWEVMARVWVGYL